MILKDTTKKGKNTTEERKRIIDCVTRLYVHFLKNEMIVQPDIEPISDWLEQVSQTEEENEEKSLSSIPNSLSPKADDFEINLLYSLLINIFRRESISWEIYIREVLNTNIQINHVISYLNEHLSALDKIRILLSLIIMSSSNHDFSMQHITKILDIAKRLDLETDGFMEIFNHLENKSLNHVTLKGHIQINVIETSIFSDYVIFGREEKCGIQFKNKSLNGVEFVLFMIDQHLFIGTNNRLSALLNDKKFAPFELYLVPRHSTIKISEIEFTSERLAKLYKNQDHKEEKHFQKEAFDFIIINNCNKISIILNRGIVFQNKNKIPRNRETELFYDDIFSIKGYSNFNVFEFFDSEIHIGVINSIPKELFIDHQADFYSLSRVENTKSLVAIEISNNRHIIHPPLKKSLEIYLNNTKITESTQFYLNTDIITINKNNFRINNFYDLVEIPFELENINVLDIKHFYADGSLGLDGISFEIKKGEVLGVLGQSGSGKSSLLKTVCGETIPTYGSIMYDGKEYYQNMNFYSQYVGYVPQDDVLFNHLTVYENLYYRGKLRLPKITREYLDRKIIKILLNTNLIHKKDTKVGDAKNKFLSGGERKRLNLALELLFDPTIIICDEPTSGLSYSDAEQVIDILRQYSEQGKFVIMTIHQPNTKVFHGFNKILIMDRGGKQVFFGKPEDVWTYFDMEYEQICPLHAETENKWGTENQSENGNEENNIENSYISRIKQKKDERLPEYVNLIIETPDYNENGEVTYEKVGRDIILKRKFTPEYWRDKYKRKMLFDLIQFDSMRARIVQTPIKKKKNRDLFLEDKQLWVFIKRNMAMKLRNHTNMYITFGQVVLLSAIIAFILRLAPSDDVYSFNQNINIGIFIFISIIIFIFLGMSNSMEEILAERKNIIREKMLNIKVSSFVYSKIVVLSLFALLQVSIYLLISFSILDIQGMFPIYLAYLFSASMIGISLGIFISSFLSDIKSIINIIPLILIPQIIFGGAIIEYEKMNRQITFIQTSPIPEVVKTMPSYWLFEGLFTAQAKLNSHDRQMNIIDKQRKLLIQDNQSTTSLNAKTEEVLLNYPKAKFQNENINFAVNIMDGRLLNTRKNVFLSSMKWIGNRTVPTYYFNFVIIILYIALIVDATVVKLKFFYKE